MKNIGMNTNTGMPSDVTSDGRVSYRNDTIVAKKYYTGEYEYTDDIYGKLDLSRKNCKDFCP